MARWSSVEVGRLLLEDEVARPVDASSLSAVSDARLVRSFVAQARRVDRRYVREVPRPLLEPTRGWAVRFPARLVGDSLPYARVEPHDTPSLARYYAKRMLGRTRRVDELLSLRDRSEWNYWHVVADLLPRLFLFEEAGLSLALPVVVAAHVYESAYFGALVTRGGLERVNWLVQGPRLNVRARRGWFGSAGRYRREVFDGLLARLGVDGVAPAAERRLFVTRTGGGWRSVSNIGELERIAERLGFDVVDPGALPLDEQIELFAGARAVAGIHGAALTNLLFRAGHPLDLFEIFSPDWLESMYFEVCRLYGHGYAALVGESSGGFDFSVPPDAFAAGLEQLLVRCGGA